MSTVLHPPAVLPVQPNEECDTGNCPAPARVAVGYPLTKKPGEFGRLVFCAHHFADLTSEVKAKAIVHHESPNHHH